MSRRASRNPCWEAEYYLKEAQEVISRSYHELESIGFHNNHSDTSNVNTTNDNSHTHHISLNEPQTAIRRRKSAVELRSFRSGVNRDQKRSVIGSKDDSRTSVSLFAINVFEDNPIPRRKRYKHRQKRNKRSNSTKLFSKSTSLINHLYNDSMTTSSDQEKPSTSTTNKSCLNKKLISTATSHNRLSDYSEDEALASSSSVDKNDLQLPRYHNMNLRSDNSVSPVTKCTLNAPNSQRTFASRGPTARKVHRRAATARLGSVVERSQLINPSNCDRNVSCKESGVKVRRAFSFRDLNGTMIDFTQQNSVKRWTSQVLAEIESLPSSRFDLNNLDSASTTITYQSNKSNDNSLTIPINSCHSSDRKNIDGISKSMQNINNVNEQITAFCKVDKTSPSLSSHRNENNICKQYTGELGGVANQINRDVTSESTPLGSGKQSTTDQFSGEGRDVVLVEPQRHRRVKSVSSLIECTKNIEMCAGLSNRNVQKVSAVVLTVSPSKQQPSSSSSPRSPSPRRPFITSLSKLRDLFPTRRYKREPKQLSTVAPQYETSQRSISSNTMSKSSTVECLCSQSQSDRSYSSSLNHNSFNRPALKSTSDLFNNQQVNVDDRRPMTSANLSNVQMRSDVSPSRVVRSFSDADPLRNIPDQSNNAEICALTKWHKMTEQRIADKTSFVHATKMNESREDDRIDNERSVSGVVASLIKVAEERRRFSDTNDNDNSINAINIQQRNDANTTKNNSVLEAATQTSPLCLSRSSSFDWINEQSPDDHYHALPTHSPESEPNDSTNAPVSSKFETAMPTTRSQAASSCITANVLADRSTQPPNNPASINEDIDESIAMLMGYVDDLKSSTDIRLTSKFIADKYSLNVAPTDGKIEDEHYSNEHFPRSKPYTHHNHLISDHLISDKTFHDKPVISCCDQLYECSDSNEMQWSKSTKIKTVSSCSSSLNKSVYDNTCFFNPTKQVIKNLSNESLPSSPSSPLCNSNQIPLCNGHLCHEKISSPLDHISTNNGTSQPDYVNVPGKSQTYSTTVTLLQRSISPQQVFNNIDHSESPPSITNIDLSTSPPQSSSHSEHSTLPTPPACNRLSRTFGSCEQINPNTGNVDQDNGRTFALTKRFIEEEAIESCRWLRDAGFPQYARFYEEGRFPIDLRSVKRDHEFLDIDSLRALFRRLNSLNRCAIMQKENVVLRKHSSRFGETLLDRSDGESNRLAAQCDDDDQFQIAISDRWKYQRKSQSWSRTNGEVAGRMLRREHARPEREESISPSCNLRELSAHCDHDANLTDNHEEHPKLALNSNAQFVNSKVASVQRSQSERLKERAKAFMKRVDARWSSRHRRIREGISCDRDRDRRKASSREPIIGNPVLVSHFSASPRPMRMFPITNQLVDNDRPSNNLAVDPSTLCQARLHNKSSCSNPNQNIPHSNNATSRRMGMIMLSPSADSSSAEDSFIESNRVAEVAGWCTNRTDPGVVPAVLRSFQSSDYANRSRVIRNDYDNHRYAPSNSIASQLLNSPSPHNNNNHTETQQLHYYTTPSCSSPEFSSCESKQIFKVPNTPTLQRNNNNRTITRTQNSTANDIINNNELIKPSLITHRSTLERSRVLSTKRVIDHAAVIDQETSYDNMMMTFSNADMMLPTNASSPPQSKSTFYTPLPSERCKLIVNADGYYEHIPDNQCFDKAGMVELDATTSNASSSVFISQPSTSSSSTWSSSCNFNRFHKDSTTVKDERNLSRIVTNGNDAWNNVHNASAFGSSFKMIGGYDPGVMVNDTAVIIPQRRDSGVGSSLSRSPSGPTTQRQIRSSLTRPFWSNNDNSSSKTRYDTATTSNLSTSVNCVAAVQGSENYHAFIDNTHLPHSIDALSVTQIIRFRKLAFLKLSALMERYVGNAIQLDASSVDTANNANMKNWTLNKFLKKMRTNDTKSMNSEVSSCVFGMPLSMVYSRSGLSLPRGILQLMHFLSTDRIVDTVGIFRKNGVRSRIAELRAKCDVAPDQDVFPHSKGLDSLLVHDMADMLKQYFRELPESLMTAKYSQLFANIYLYLPSQHRLKALQRAVLLLPDENREALQTLLFFLHDVASHSSANNMNAQNLAVCLAPSLFHLSTVRLNRMSPARRHKTIGASGMPTEREMKESRASQECLAQMIDSALELFILNKSDQDCDYNINSSLVNDISGYDYENDADDYQLELPFLNELGIADGGNYRTYLIQKAMQLIKEHNERWKGWIVEGLMDGVEISTKKADDGHVLRYFRVWTDIEAPPKQLLLRLMKQRNVWDRSVINWRSVASLNDDDCDLYQYVLNDTPAHPTRDVLVVRLWKTELKELRGGCVLIERSVRSSETQLLGAIPAVALASRFLIEPYSGRSRITYISRVDLRGRSNLWYGKVYGALVARQMSLLRESFKRNDHKNDGPETNV